MIDKKYLDVILLTQTFEEAGSIEAFPNLELLKMIFSTITSGGAWRNEIKIKRLNEALQREAYKSKGTHVFGVKYYPNINRPDQATGDVYTTKETLI